MQRAHDKYSWIEQELKTTENYGFLLQIEITKATDEVQMNDVIGLIFPNK